MDFGSYNNYSSNIIDIDIKLSQVTYDVLISVSQCHTRGGAYAVFQTVQIWIVHQCPSWIMCTTAHDIMCTLNITTLNYTDKIQTGIMYMNKATLNAIGKIRPATSRNQALL